MIKLSKARNKGVTLIALIITIIVLLILAGVSIATLTGENGTINEATSAKQEAEIKTWKERIDTAIMQAENKNVNPTIDQIIDELEKSGIIKDSSKVNKETGVITTKEPSYEISGKLDYYMREEELDLPELLPGMTAIYWDNSGNEVTVTAENKNNWYNYEEQRWANAKTPDGSYWVWIPRFEYKITSTTTDPTQAGTVDIRLISENVKKGSAGYTTDSDGITRSQDGYITHPAFCSGVDNGYKNGEWNRELTGIWVAKFEMSKEITTDGGITWQNAEAADVENGNVEVNDTVRAVSKPGVKTWQYINTANSYENAYNYDRSKDSHLMKNSEWGAVAYFTYSKYGRSGAEVAINNNIYYTGGGIGDEYKVEVSQSSTNNITGIYDLAGGSWEYVAGYNKDAADSYFEGNFKSQTGKIFMAKGGSSTKYATVYSNSQVVYGNDFSVGDVSHIGDAIHEVYVSNNKGWFSDASFFVGYHGPVFVRGGAYYSPLDGGIFATTETNSAVRKCMYI